MTGVIPNVGSLPELNVNTEALTSAAAMLRRRSGELSDATVAVNDRWRGLPVVFSMTGTESIYSALQPAVTVAEEYAEALRSAGRALTGFAETVQGLQGERAEIAAQIGSLRDMVRAAEQRDVLGLSGVPATDGEGVMEAFSPLQMGIGEVHSRISELSARFEQAEYDCAAALRAIDGGVGASLPVGVVDDGAGVAGAGPAGTAWPSQVELLTVALSSVTLATLKRLGGLSESQIASWFTAHPEKANELWDRPPDVRAVESWWAALGADAQASLIAAAPLVIGNLNGVPYGTRVVANRANVTTGIATLTARVGELRKLPPHDRPVNVGKLEEQIDYYEKLRDEKVSFFDGERGEIVESTGHHLLIFDHDRDAIAEYSGVLDADTGNIPASVTSLGVYVPGTGASLATFEDDVLRSELFVEDGRPRGSVGMVTWKGGAFPQSLEAVSGDLTEELGGRLALFGDGLDRAHSATLTGLGYSAGGSILGSAEQGGLKLDRSLQVSGAGMGHGVRSLSEYPETSDIPHYSLMAPGDFIVGYIQGAEVGGWGHGGSPLTTAGFTRLETGFNVAGDRSSGRVTGHFDVWDVRSTSQKQILHVITGGQVELYAEPQLRYTNPGTGRTGRAFYSDPLLQDDYEPEMRKVEGESK